jgi:hypothetical protein
VNVVTLALAATVPSPSPTSSVPDVDVTPGVAGFVAIALVAIVTILLIVDMTRRIRRTRYRSEIRERLEHEGDGVDDRTGVARAEDGLPHLGDDDPERR